MDDYPFLRAIQSPVTRDQLRPLDARCRTVQFSDPLSESDHEKLADFLRDYPAISLRIYGRVAHPRYGEGGVAMMDSVQEPGFWVHHGVHGEHG